MRLLDIQHPLADCCDVIILMSEIWGLRLAAFSIDCSHLFIWINILDRHFCPYLMLADRPWPCGDKYVADFFHEASHVSPMPLHSFAVIVSAPSSDSIICHAPLQQLRLGAETTIITIFHMMEESMLVQILRKYWHVYSLACFQLEYWRKTRSLITQTSKGKSCVCVCVSAWACVWVCVCVCVLVSDTSSAR